MNKEFGFPSSRGGTGHILKDLIGSIAVVRERNPSLKLLNATHYSVTETLVGGPLTLSSTSSPQGISCLICGGSEGVDPISIEAMQILAKYVFTPEQMTLISSTEHLLTLSCKICSSIFQTLLKLSQQINDTAICIRIVFGATCSAKNKTISAAEILYNFEETLTLHKSSTEEEQSDFVDVSTTTATNIAAEEMEIDLIVKTEDMDSSSDNEEITKILKSCTFFCEKCGEPFIKRDRFECHVKGNKCIFPPTKEMQEARTSQNSQQDDNKLEKRRKRTVGLTLTEHLHACEICGKCFPAAHRLREHIMRTQKHHSDFHSFRLRHRLICEPKKCDVCVLYFVCQKAYAEHLTSSAHLNGSKSRRVADNGSVTFVCKNCAKSHDSLLDFVQHGTECGKTYCEPCREYYSDYKGHVRTIKHVDNLKKVEVDKTQLLDRESVQMRISSGVSLFS